MKKGDPVTVVFVPTSGPLIVTAVVTAVHVTIGGFVCEPCVIDPRFLRWYGTPVLGRMFTEEGTMWCHGWEGTTVEALRAAQALA